MTNNIAIAPPFVNTPLSDAEFREAIEAVAQQIQHFERSAIFRIANRLAWVHEQFLYRRDEGGFQGWVESRLGYSRAQAYRLLNVATLIKSVSGWDTFGTLPATALYQLAAPSTPVPARDEIIDRLKAGERLSCAMVTEVIAKATNSQVNSIVSPAIEPVEPAIPSSIFSDWEFRRRRLDADGAREQDGAAVVDHADAGGDHAEEPAQPEPKAKPDLETLAARWEMSLPEEQQVIRDRVLADFFAQAAGAHIAARIPITKHANVVRPLLDQLGVDGMLQAMSSEFGHRLRAKLKRTAKPFKKINAVKTGKGTYALEGRGSRSTAH